MGNEVAEINPVIIGDITRVLVQGDLAKLNEKQRLDYYTAICDSLGLNKLTQPFEFIVLKGKLKLYATKNCTDQLRKLHGISTRIIAIEVMGSILCVRAQASDSTGRVHEDEGCVSLQAPRTDEEGVVTFHSLEREDLANARMKCFTKAIRRATLGCCGLGILDESELDTIREDEPPPQVTIRQAVQPDAAPVMTTDSEQKLPPPTDAQGDEIILSDQQQRDLLAAIQALDLTWSEQKTRTRASEIIGREIHHSSHIGTLTVREYELLLAAMREGAAKKAEAAAKRAAKKGATA